MTTLSDPREAHAMRTRHQQRENTRSRSERAPRIDKTAPVYCKCGELIDPADAPFNRERCEICNVWLDTSETN